MSKGTLVSKIALAKKKAEDGVDYTSRFGAKCPWCETKTKVLTTRPWADDMRIRYHKCTKSGCLIANMGLSIKSIEIDGEGAS